MTENLLQISAVVLPVESLDQGNLRGLVCVVIELRHDTVGDSDSVVEARIMRSGDVVKRTCHHKGLVEIFRRFFITSLKKFFSAGIKGFYIQITTKFKISKHEEEEDTHEKKTETETDRKKETDTKREIEREKERDRKK